MGTLSVRPAPLGPVFNKKVCDDTSSFDEQLSAAFKKHANKGHTVLIIWIKPHIDEFGNDYGIDPVPKKTNPWTAIHRITASRGYVAAALDLIDPNSLHHQWPFQKGDITHPADIGRQIICIPHEEGIEPKQYIRNPLRPVPKYIRGLVVK